MTRRHSQSGIALLTVLLLLLVTSAMLAGFTTNLMTDARLRSVDETQTQAFYAAHGALEQLTADVGNLFSANFAPTAADLDALTAAPPAIPGVTFEDPDGNSGYAITFDDDGMGNPLATAQTIASGPYQGFIGLLTPYNLSIVARTSDTATAGSEVWLERQMQTVAIPVFQFGIFSETDLSFFAGPDFNFGGRVHTNGNLFLASGNGSTLTLSDKVTAVKEVVRSHLSNGRPIGSTGHTGTVEVLTAPGAYRDLAQNEGSLVNTLGSNENEPTWTNVSIGAYNGNIRNGRTGARTLTLPFVSLGATPIDMIRRGVPGEAQELLDQRYFELASLRILLSDTAADLAGLPGVTADAPVPLTTMAAIQAMGYTGVEPLALSDGENVMASDDIYRSAQDTPLLGGFIKIEAQTAIGWQDVTMEILNLGFTARNKSMPLAACGVHPSADAVIRLQRVRDLPIGGGNCGIGNTSPYSYWPNTLYDTREGNPRDNQSTGASTIYLGGVMHYVELDANNLRRWLTGQIGLSGTSAIDVNGYTVYFSDRRNNRDLAGNETGEYGFEDFNNPASAAGTPNATLDDGEDVNGNGTLEVYGQYPAADGVPNASLPGAELPLTNAARPFTNISDVSGLPEFGTAAVPTGAQIAQANRAILFRRALKLTNGALGNIVSPGLTIASENPVYIQGDWNADSSGFGDPHVATSVIADSVTFLSNSWNDVDSFTDPQNPAGRDASTTWYRLAVIGGKGPSFPRPTGYSVPNDYGTDGGVHNFLRFVERWSGDTLNFRGSIASFYFNRQGIGTYKCCTNVYSPPTRAFAFDLDFLDPTLLPPYTPMFRDLNTTGFRQVIR